MSSPSTAKHTTMASIAAQQPPRPSIPARLPSAVLTATTRFAASRPVYPPRRRVIEIRQIGDCTNRHDPLPPFARSAYRRPVMHVDQAL